MSPKPAMDVILHRTLILRLSSIGDIVLASPLIRALRTRFPQARIDFLVREDLAGLTLWNPHLSTTLTFPARGGLADLRDFRRRIRRTGYDLLIDIHGSLRTRFLTAGFPTVRVNKRKAARFLLVHAGVNAYDRLGGAPSVALRYLETVSPLGVRDDGGGLEFAVPPAAAERAREVIAGAGIASALPLIGVCPGARHATKRWPPDRFAAVAAALAAGKGCGVIVFGSEEERGLCAGVADGVRGIAPDVPVMNAAGCLTLPETGASMDRCLLVLTNDSGLMHIAAARSRPVVALFGSTVRELGFTPFRTRSAVEEEADLSCRPCTHIGRRSCPRGHFRCMLDIPGERVLGTARRILAES